MDGKADLSSHAESIDDAALSGVLGSDDPHVSSAADEVPELLEEP